MNDLHTLDYKKWQRTKQEVFHQTKFNVTVFWQMAILHVFHCMQSRTINEWSLLSRYCIWTLANPLSRSCYIVTIFIATNGFNAALNTVMMGSCPYVYYYANSDIQSWLLNWHVMSLKVKGKFVHDNSDVTIIWS